MAQLRQAIQLEGKRAKSIWKTLNSEACLPDLRSKRTIWDEKLKVKKKFANSSFTINNKHTC